MSELIQNTVDSPLPGFRFYPTEEELVSFYLHHKLSRTPTNLDRIIPVLDIYEYNPWDLPDFAGELCRRDNEQWFFFIPRQEREARGGRPNRLTTDGYWKATGSPGEVYSSRNNMVIGRKRTMVFYVGRAPNGTKTIWKMNEYKAVESFDEASSSMAPNSQVREELSLCRLYKRSRTLRAFDRRPAVTGADLANVQQPSHVSDSTATDNFQHYHDPSMGPDRWSAESSSPGIPANPSPENEHNNPVESETWWDSDQFKWFDLGKI